VTVEAAGPGSGPRGRLFYGWVMVVALGLSLIVALGSSTYLFGLLIVPAERDMHWTRTELSSVVALSSIVFGVAGLPIGRIVDRSGPRKLMAAGSVLAATCLLLTATIHQLWLLYIVWGLLFGIAGALTSQTVASTTINNWFVRRRGTALAIFVTIMGLSGPVYVPAASWLIQTYGWRVAVSILGLVFLIVPLPLSLLLRHRPEDIGLHPDGAERTAAGDAGKLDVGGSTFREAMSHPFFWILTAATFLSATAFGAVSVHQVPAMIGRGISPVLAGSVVGTLGFLSIPGRFVFNSAGDWFGARRMLIVVIALQAVGIGVLTFAQSLPYLFLYATIYGIAAGSAFGLRAAMMGEMFGRRALGSISAVYFLFIYLATALGPIAAGLMYDRYHNYNLAFQLATALTAVSIVGLLLLPRTPRERERALAVAT
jgi:MFS family permease